jgi:hypothetical protein
LPEGSLRKYKRGHRARAVKEENIMLARDDPPFFPPDIDEIIADPSEESGSAGKIFRVAAQTENDPEPAIFRKDKESRERRTPLKITQTVRKDVEGKIAFMLLATGNAWQLADPICGTVLVEQTADISARLAPILCQSPAVVEWFQKGTSIMMYVELLMALAPVATTFYRHHLSRAEEPVPETPFTNDYYQVR